MRVKTMCVAWFVSLVALCPVGAQQPEIATTVAFTEGPTVDKEGNVYFTEIVQQRIMKLSADGVLSTYRENSNVANGLLIDSQGRLIACEGGAFERPGVKLAGKPRVTRTDLTTGRVEVLADNYQGKPLTGPNDVSMDGKGRLYFTELAGGAVYGVVDAERSRFENNTATSNGGAIAGSAGVLRVVDSTFVQNKAIAPGGGGDFGPTFSVLQVELAEPGSIALIGIALAGLGFSRRKRAVH